MSVRIQLRRGTASEWSSANPVLAEGEIGVEVDTGYFKIGDGTTTWNLLGTGSLGTNAVDVRTIDAKGDLLAGTADDTITRLPVGPDGYVLVANSSQTTGLEWANPIALIVALS